jgi:prepilin-type N-terminal cleavage/methylation domain-containing protein
VELRSQNKLVFMFIGHANRKAILDSSKRVARRDGFTLLEITLAVAILAMMSLAIYRFVQSNLTALRASSDASVADARYNGLRDLLQAQWQSLPPRQGAMTGEPFKLNDRQRDEIKWTCSAGPGLLTRYAPGKFTVQMRLQPESDKNDRLDLGFLRKPQDDSAIGRESWVPLIKNVSSLQIQYFDPQVNSWADQWTNPLRLPPLVKVTVGRIDAAVPWEAIIPLKRTPF